MINSEKHLKHERAQRFREKLMTHSGRIEAVSTLARKSIFDEEDLLAIKILIQKKFMDCKSIYPLLILKLKEKDMTAEASEFIKMWKAH